MKDHLKWPEIASIILVTDIIALFLIRARLFEGTKIRSQ